MEILSLIYTKRIKTKIVSNFLVNECGFWHLEKCNTEVIYCESMKGISIKVSKFNIEIMYENEQLEEIVSLIENLSGFNENKKITIINYKNEGENNIKFLLKDKLYYLI